MQVRTGGADRDGPASAGWRVVAPDRAGVCVLADDRQDAVRALERRYRCRARGLQLSGAAAAGGALVSVGAERRAAGTDSRSARQDRVGRDASDGALRRPAPLEHRQGLAPPRRLSAPESAATELAPLRVDRGRRAAANRRAAAAEVRATGALGDR